jgi:hypothetical protein
MAAPLHSRDSWSRIPPEFETATDATIISKRLSIGGLALDLLRKGNSGPGRRLGYEVHLIANATRAVYVHADDGKLEGCYRWIDTPGAGPGNQ